MGNESSEKICVFCGEDCAGQPRGKDPMGRYYHLSCYEDAKARRQQAEPAPQPGSGAGTSGAGGQSAEDEYGMLGAITDDLQPPPVAAQCPSCGSPMAPGAVICTNCG